MSEEDERESIARRDGQIIVKEQPRAEKANIAGLQDDTITQL